MDPKPKKILRRAQVLDRVGCSASTLRRLPDFPQPVSIGPGSSGYLEHEVAEWIEKRAAARKSEAA